MYNSVACQDVCLDHIRGITNTTRRRNDLDLTPLYTWVAIISSPAVSYVPHFIPLLYTVPGTTCRNKTLVRASLSDNREFRASAGTLAKASFVDAKTVKGPGVDRTEARSASVSTSTRVENLGSADATSAMVFSGVNGYRTSDTKWITPLLATKSGYTT